MTTGNVNISFPGGINSPGLDWYLELVFWLLVFTFSYRTRSWLIMAFAIGGSLHLVNPAWSFGLAQSIPLIGLAALLEILVRRHKATQRRS